MRFKIIVAVAFLVLLSLFTAFAAPTIWIEFFGQTLGVEGTACEKVLVEPNPKGLVCWHERVNIPGGNAVLKFTLPIRDDNGDSIPETNTLKEDCFELSDISVAIHPEAFFNAGAYSEGGHSSIGLMIDVYTSDNTDLVKRYRASVTWRGESIISQNYENLPM
ncbi:MAG: hypothetical protein ABIK28_15960, partial [Planctomycetota bacterium]